MLRSRFAKLLGTVAQVANLLLRSPDFTTVVSDVVRLLGEAVGSDRCWIMQEVARTYGNLAVHVPTQWCRSGIPGTFKSTPGMKSLMLWENFAEFRQKYLRGEAANFLIADIAEPARSILAAQGNTSMLIVPSVVIPQLPSK